MRRSVLRFGFGALALIISTAAFAAENPPAAVNLAVVELPEDALMERMIAARPIGEVVLPSGRVVAADPLVNPDRPPFEQTVPPGRYPVTLFYAQGRNALAMLRVAPGKVARWRVATIPGQDASTLKDDEIFGYGVDAGLGSFMDAEAPKAMEKRGRQDPKCDNYYDCVLAEELGANGDDYVIHRPLKDADVNVAVFSSGWGDGFYASYWGEDEAGKPLVLVTDFGVLENGDGRTVQQLRVAAMTPQQQDDARKAHEAILRDDAETLRGFLADGRVTAESFSPETGETLTLEAIRGDKPKSLEMLARYGATRELDAETARLFELKTYSDYVGYLERLTPGVTEPAPKFSAALKSVLARWDAGAIPRAPDIPAAPAGGETPRP